MRLIIHLQQLILEMMDLLETKFKNRLLKITSRQLLSQLQSQYHRLFLKKSQKLSHKRHLNLFRKRNQRLSHKRLLFQHHLQNRLKNLQLWVLSHHHHLRLLSNHSKIKWKRPKKLKIKSCKILISRQCLI